ncbi:MAG: ribosomal protection-like ABC-F family protein [Chloroflexota bacterium]
MLVVSNLTKRFPGALDYVLKDVSFTVNYKERVGLIGPNGSGKSTLLKIIQGTVQPDSGSVQFVPGSLRVGFLNQHLLNPQITATVEAAVFPQLASIRALEARIAELATEATAGVPHAVGAYDAALNELMLADQRMDQNRAMQAMVALGVGSIDMNTPIDSLSGGQKTRVLLAQLVAAHPQLLVLDEPTNHLDVDALDWLEHWLMNFEGGVLVVSHDRAFLDRVITKTIALTTESAEARVVAGSYTDYVNTLQHERERQWVTWKDQEDEITRIRADVSRTMAKAIKRENATVNDFQRGRAKVVAQKAKAKEARLERYLASADRVEKPALNWDVKIKFETVHPIRGDAIALEDLSIGYSADKPILHNLSKIVGRHDRIVITGPNGHGKTSLLKTIAGEIDPLEGRVIIADSARVGYLAQEQDVLDPESTPVETIQALTKMSLTEARSFLHFFLFEGDDATRPIQLLSYGERTRLMLARLIAGGMNLLLMDEPLNHLDVTSREKFEAALRHFNGSMLVIAHDRYFIDHVATRIWRIEDGQLDETFHQPGTTWES